MGGIKRETWRDRRNGQQTLKQVIWSYEDWGARDKKMRKSKYILKELWNIVSEPIYTLWDLQEKRKKKSIAKHSLSVIMFNENELKSPIKRHTVKMDQRIRSIYMLSIRHSL